MTRGKQTCRILKEIRRQIAQANDIAFVTSDCQYKGDCTGTCPKCESEVRYLEEQLQARSQAGLSIRLAGVSLGLSTLVTLAGCQASSNPTPSQQTDSLEAAMIDELPCPTVIQGLMPLKVASEGVSDHFTDEALTDSARAYREAFDLSEVMPSFPGGNKALIQFIRERTTLLDTVSVEQGTQGTVVCQFIVDEQGYVRYPHIVRSLNPQCDQFALEIIRQLPRWTPGTQDGKPVAITYTVPVRYGL